MERDFKGIWIPKEIWESKDLTLQEKVFLVEIDSLDNEEGCFASNDHFSDFFGLSKNRCSEIISSLSKKELIEVNYQYKKGKKSIEKRILRVFEKPNRHIRNIDEPIRQTDRPIRETGRGYSEKGEDNNTINNTVNNTINNPIGACAPCDDETITDSKNLTKKQVHKLFNAYAKENEELLEALVAFDNMRRANRKPLSTKRSVELLLNNLDKLAMNEDEKIQIVDQSTLSNWAKLYELKSCTQSNSKTTNAPKSAQRFNNISSHNWDFDELERLEREHVQRKLKE